MGIRAGRFLLTLGVNRYLIVFGSGFWVLAMELTLQRTCRLQPLTAGTEISVQAAGSHGNPSIPGIGPVMDNPSSLSQKLAENGVGDDFSGGSEAIRWVFSHFLTGTDTGWLSVRQEKEG